MNYGLYESYIYVIWIQAFWIIFLSWSEFITQIWEWPSFPNIHYEHKITRVKKKIMFNGDSHFFSLRPASKFLLGIMHTEILINSNNYALKLNYILSIFTDRMLKFWRAFCNDFQDIPLPSVCFFIVPQNKVPHLRCV